MNVALFWQHARVGWEYSDALFSRHAQLRWGSEEVRGSTRDGTQHRVGLCTQAHVLSLKERRRYTWRERRLPVATLMRDRGNISVGNFLASKADCSAVESK